MYKVNALPSEARELLVESYHLYEQFSYQAQTVQSKNSGTTLITLKQAKAIELQDVKRDKLIFATDSYDAHKFTDTITSAVLDEDIFIPRVEKAKEEQKRRTKVKAEVFTPSWVCNLQNNLIDEAALGYSNAFNTPGEDRKLWTPTKKKIKFTKAYTWAHYVTEKRIEFTLGEAPYLISPYDTVTGDIIPVRDAKGNFARIGLLDRKLRVAFENVTNVNDWKQAAFYALRATYGYEWQGDNLVLARLNFINTYSDYLRECWGQEPTDEDLIKVAEIASWNLWQMDGLKMVTPESCSKTCIACVKKTRGGHDGELALIRMGKEYKSFEALGPADWFPVKVTQKQSNSLF